MTNTSSFARLYIFLANTFHAYHYDSAVNPNTSLALILAQQSDAQLSALRDGASEFTHAVNRELLTRKTAALVTF